MRFEKNNQLVQNTEQTRVIAEIQAIASLAQKNQRDELACLQKIIKQCQRTSMAESAMYSFPRGGKNITGASIRLAEVLARSYTNIEYGIKILSQDHNKCHAVAYCWDLENNVRKADYFDVIFERYTQKEGIKKLIDPRDIYEHIASQGARRIRACILAIIPSDIVEAAIKECEKTLQSNVEPLSDRIKSLISHFTKYNVSIEMLEKYIEKKLDIINDNDLLELRKIYQSIKDGMSYVSDHFQVKIENKNKVNIFDTTEDNQKTNTLETSKKKDNGEAVLETKEQDFNLQEIKENLEEERKGFL